MPATNMNIHTYATAQAERRKFHEVKKWLSGEPSAHCENTHVNRMGNRMHIVGDVVVGKRPTILMFSCSERTRKTFLLAPVFSSQETLPAQRQQERESVFGVM